jgi:hypothetical protein
MISATPISLRAFLSLSKRFFNTANTRFYVQQRIDARAFGNQNGIVHRADRNIAMRFPGDTANTATTALGPSLIAAGLAALLIQVRWPDLPVATSLALIALGTTLETVGGFRRAANGPGIIAVHLFVYASLYLFFIAAICDASMRQSHGGLSLIAIIDFGMSAGVMAVVARLCITSMVADRDPPVN